MSKRANKHESVVFSVVCALRNVKKDRQCFSFSGRVPVELFALGAPGLKVNDQFVHLPATKHTVDDLIANGVLAQAPFGRGEETVFDGTVRKTWQVSSDNVQFDNDEFHDHLRLLTELAVTSLGIEVKSKSFFPVEAKLHKALIYATGDHFEYHRDSVHSPGQFATLVIDLPSVYEGGMFEIKCGGDLIQIEHDKEKRRHYSYWSVFYSDCLHRVKPVESGYRTCLTFDLFLKGNIENSASLLPHFNELEISSFRQVHQVEIQNLARALKEWDAVVARLRKHNLLATPNYHKVSFEFDEKDKCSHDESEEDTRYSKFCPGLVNVKEINPQSLVLVLDHLLPSRDIMILHDAEHVQNHLGTFRGRDRIRIRALLEAIKISGCEFDISTGKFFYRVQLHHEAEATVTTHCKFGEHWPVDISTVRGLGLDKVLEVLSFSSDTGNEGIQYEYRYEFCAIMLIPKPCRISILENMIVSAYTTI